MNTKQLGDEGERLVIQRLSDEGYEILAHQFRCAYGEIDIIAKSDEHIVFVEVKTRRSMKFGSAREAVGKAKQKRIYDAASFYLQQKDLKDQPLRFDVVEVYKSGGNCIVNHIKNAF